MHIGGPRQRALLAYLVLRANSVVTTAQIVDALWGEFPPTAATKSVQVYVSRLRRDLGADGDRLVETHGNGYRLVVGATDSDLAQLGALGERARALARTDPEAAISVYSDALGLWRGAPLSDVADAPFAAAAIASLNEVQLDLVEGRVEARLALGRHSEVIPELQQAIASHPLRERLRAQLVVALYRSGRQSEALTVIRVLRQRLGEELGLDPGPQLQELEQRVLRHDTSLLLSKAPAASPEPIAPANDQQADVPEPPARPRHRRAAIVALCVGTVGIVGAATAIALWPDANSTGTRANSLTAGTVAVIDDAGYVVADLPVGSAPGPVAITGGIAWVGDLSDHTVTEFNIRDGKVLKRYGLPTAPVSLTPQGDRIWVGDGFEGTLSRILVSDQQLSAPFFPDRRIGGLLAVAAGTDRLWVGLADRQVLVLDPSDLHVQAATDVKQRIGALAALPTAAVAIPLAGSDVLRIEASGRTTRLARLRGQPVAVTVGFGGIWIATARPNRLVRLDPATGAVRSDVTLAHTPTALAAAGRALWVAEPGAELIEHIPIDASAVRSELRIGRPIGGIAADGRRVYVAVRSRA